jgi:hypothetical protein
MHVKFTEHPRSFARGRNGYFIPAESFINGWSEQNGQEQPPLVNIDVYSKRGARTEPIMLRLTIEDAKKFQDAIGAAISEATA